MQKKIAAVAAAAATVTTTSLKICIIKYILQSLGVITANDHATKKTSNVGLNTCTNSQPSEYVGL